MPTKVWLRYSVYSLGKMLVPTDYLFKDSQEPSKGWLERRNWALCSVSNQEYTNNCPEWINDSLGTDENSNKASKIKGCTMPLSNDIYPMYYNVREKLSIYKGILIRWQTFFVPQHCK